MTPDAIIRAEADRIAPSIRHVLTTKEGDIGAFADILAGNIIPGSALLGDDIADSLSWRERHRREDLCRLRRTDSFEAREKQATGIRIAVLQAVKNYPLKTDAEWGCYHATILAVWQTIAPEGVEDFIQRGKEMTRQAKIRQQQEAEEQARWEQEEKARREKEERDARTLDFEEL